MASRVCLNSGGEVFVHELVESNHLSIHELSDWLQHKLLTTFWGWLSSFRPGGTKKSE